MFKTQYPEYHTPNGHASRKLQYQSHMDELQRNWKNLQNACRLQHPNLTEVDVYKSVGELEVMDRVAARINRSIYEEEDDIGSWLDD